MKILITTETYHSGGDRPHGSVNLQTLFSVRANGVEPSRVLPHMNLNHARLPISPRSDIPNLFDSFALSPERDVMFHPVGQRARHLSYVGHPTVLTQKIF